jgi:hypothetical protein
MLEAFLPKSAIRVVVYLEPVNVRQGVEKLARICRDVVRIEPDSNTCFLFVNRRRDTLAMYFAGYDGEQILTKKLDKGSFLLPARDAQGQPFVVLKPSILRRLFRS